MLNWRSILILMLAAAATSGDQFVFDWSKDPAGQTPPGFSSLVTGPGRPAEWMVTDESVPPILAPVTSQGREMTTHSVLSVRSFDLSEAHTPILLFTNEIFSDFTFVARLKISGGVVAPMAGVVFRAQDASNYYVLRASTEGNLLWYRVINGQSYENMGIGVRLPFAKDTWRELRIECNGSAMRCFLDGKLVVPPVRPGASTEGLAINDTTFSSGKVGFWTKADTQCAFAEARVEYSPKVAFAQIVIGEVAKKYRPLELLIYADKQAGLPVLIATAHNQPLGSPGTKYDQDVIDRGAQYYQKFAGAVEVTLPLRDRNGDVAAAFKVRMKSFPGETQTTAVERATVLKNAMEKRLGKMENLTE